MRKIACLLFLLMSCRHMPHVSGTQLADPALNCQRKCIAAHIQCLDAVTDWHFIWFFLGVIHNASAKDEQVSECQLAQQYCDIGCRAAEAP